MDDFRRQTAVLEQSRYSFDAGDLKGRKEELARKSRRRLKADLRRELVREDANDAR